MLEECINTFFKDHVCLDKFCGTLGIKNKKGVEVISVSSDEHAADDEDEDEDEDNLFATIPHHVLNCPSHHFGTASSLEPRKGAPVAPAGEAPNTSLAVAVVAECNNIGDPETVSLVKKRKAELICTRKPKKQRASSSTGPVEESANSTLPSVVRRSARGSAPVEEAANPPFAVSPRRSVRRRNANATE